MKTVHSKNRSRRRDACEVSSSAVEAFVTLASHLRPGDCGDQVLMPVIALSQSDDDEEARSMAVQLLGRLAESLGQELCKQFVGVQLAAFCEDGREGPQLFGSDPLEAT